MPKKTKLKDPNEIIQNFNTQRAIQLYEFVSHQFLKFYRANSIASMTENLSYAAYIYEAGPRRSARAYNLF